MPPIKAREVDALEATFEKDPETGKMMADVVIIKAGRAKNPRNYRPAALEKAAREGIYNGMRMFVDHSDKPPVKRKFTEMVSAVESTSWDPAVGKQGGVRGKVEFFDESFFNFAQRAQKYMGLSVDQRNLVTYTQEGSQRIEDVQQVAFARSVDWVIYPSAGGEVLSFAREGEGDEQVEWGDITLDQLQANAPELFKQIQATATSAKEETDDPETPPVLTAAEIQALVAKGVQEAIQASNQTAEKRNATTKAVRDYVAKSGLPMRIQSRLVNMFSDALEYVETDVQQAVDDAKDELKELGVTVKIQGEGPSGDAAKGGKPTSSNAREGVEAIFGFEKKS